MNWACASDKHQGVLHLSIGMDSITMLRHMHGILGVLIGFAPLLSGSSILLFGVIFNICYKGELQIRSRAFRMSRSFTCVAGFHRHSSHSRIALEDKNLDK
jgi:hypothetical protein